MTMIRTRRRAIARMGRPGVSLILAAMLLLLAGCQPGIEGPGAEQLGDLYYEAVKAGDFEAAAALYEQGAPRQDIVEELETTRERLGTLEDYTRTDLVSYIAGGAPSYTLKFKTRYAQSHATEDLLIQYGPDKRLHISRIDFRPGGAR